MLTFSSVSVLDDAHTKGMFVFAEEVEKLTNGEIKVEVFPGGQLFTQEGEQVAAWEREVNEIVYRLYDLTAEEIALIEECTM